MNELFGSPWCRPFAIPATCLMSCLLLTAYPRPAAGQVAVPFAAQAEQAAPAIPPPAPAPEPGNVPIDCGGYFASSCIVCCPHSPQPCSQVTTSSVLQTALDAGCTVAPNNDCGECDSSPPTPAPGPAPAPQDCLWVAAYEGDWQAEDGISKLWSLPYTAAVALPGCLTQVLDNACLNTFSSADESQQYWGGQGLGGGKGCSNGAAALASVVNSNVSGTASGPNEYWYLDANCQVTSPDADTQLCGYGAVFPSPISLLWEDDASLTDGMTVVPFSIDARQPEAFSLWKASEKAPLLVYDPTHTGKVTSAKQLFGTYTFGGRTTKAAYSQSNEASTPWGNGYEALALLDTNHDGKISGKELDALALWFDKNRDGISQPGEVKTLSSLGVVTIYYKPDRTDPKSGDIHADLGFERLVNGKRVKGASVDWLAQTFSTKQEAMVALERHFPARTEHE